METKFKTFTSVKEKNEKHLMESFVGFVETKVHTPYFDDYVCMHLDNKLPLCVKRSYLQYVPTCMTPIVELLEGENEFERIIHLAHIVRLPEWKRMETLLCLRRNWFSRMIDMYANGIKIFLGPFPCIFEHKAYTELRQWKNHVLDLVQ
jgi:hypothetical protein